MIVIGAVDMPLLELLWPTLAALAAVPLVAVAVTLLRARTDAPAEMRLSNPLQLSTAWMRLWFGDAGTYAIATIAGFVDVDAVALTLARAAAGGGLEPVTAARGIAIAAIVNTGVKAGIAAVIGGRSMLRAAGLALGATMAVAAVTAVATLRA